MARVVKAQEHAVKRNEILDSAQRLVETRGYEQMAIQDILDDLHISKGAFYHYFDSKGALLEALVDRMLVEVERLLTPIAQDPHLTPSGALQRFFVIFARYKAEQKPVILRVLSAWFGDDNAIVREKVRVAMAGRLRPLVASIIRRGCEQGVFAVSYPDEAAHLVLGLTQDLGDALGRAVLEEQTEPDAHTPVEALMAATTEAVERVLGAATGSFRLAEVGALDTWFEQSRGAKQ